MEITIKFKGREIVFGEWEEIFGEGTYQRDRDDELIRVSCLRRAPKPDIPGTRIEWGWYLTNGEIYWYRDFQGGGIAAGLYSLRHVYDQMYPDVWYRHDQKKEAQDHMDEFVRKYNSLKAFL